MTADPFDDRVLCVDCQNLRRRDTEPRCSAHRRAGLGEYLPRELLTLPQRCPAFTRAPAVRTTRESAEGVEW